MMPVMAAIVGCAGLVPVMAALEAGRTVALANKEALVSAGALMTDAATRTGATILPVDSEHSALFQCLEGRRAEELDSIVLTASGGPFRGRSREDVEVVALLRRAAEVVAGPGPPQVARGRAVTAGERGLVERRPNPRDGRSVLVRLTADGATHVDDAMLATAAEAAMMASGSSRFSPSVLSAEIALCRSWCGVSRFRPTAAPYCPIN